jgi:ketosteroid isomerase-like protein
MSQENVELVRRMIAAFNAREWDQALSLFAPNGEWHAYMAALESRLYGGRAAIREMWHEMQDAFPDFTVEAEELNDFGDRVIVSVAIRGTGKASGVESLIRFTQLYTLSEGQITRVEGFRERNEALEAVSLSEPDAHAGS